MFVCFRPINYPSFRDVTLDLSSHVHGGWKKVCDFFKFLLLCELLRDCRWGNLIALNEPALLLPFPGISASGAAAGSTEGGPVADNAGTAGLAFPGGGAGRLHHPWRRMGELFHVHVHASVGLRHSNIISVQCQWLLNLIPNLKDLGLDFLWGAGDVLELKQLGASTSFLFRCCKPAVPGPVPSKSNTAGWSYGPLFTC